MAWIMRVALGLAFCGACVTLVGGEEQPSKPKLQIEFRWADYNPIKGLTEDNGIDLSCSDKKAYLHKKAVLTNAEVTRARLLKANAAPGDRYIIEVNLTKEAGEKLSKASKENLNKPLVVLIDGKVVAAMVVMSRLTDVVPMPGYFTEVEGERIVKGIN